MNRLFPRLKLVVVIEPAFDLQQPYQVLTADHLVRFESVTQFLTWLPNHSPDLVTLSTSLSPDQALQVCEALLAQTRSHNLRLPALLWIVNHQTPLAQLLGTNWSGRVGILSNLSSPQEILSTLERILT